MVTVQARRRRAAVSRLARALAPDGGVRRPVPRARAPAAPAQAAPAAPAAAPPGAPPPRRPPCSSLHVTVYEGVVPMREFARDMQQRVAGVHAFRYKTLCRKTISGSYLQRKVQAWSDSPRAHQVGFAMRDAGKRLVGFAVCEALRRYPWVETTQVLFVSLICTLSSDNPARRGGAGCKGSGSMLLASVEEWARRRFGATVAVLQATSRRETWQFYLGQGYTRTPDACAPPHLRDRWARTLSEDVWVKPAYREAMRGVYLPDPRDGEDWNVVNDVVVMSKCLQPAAARRRDLALTRDKQTYDLTLRKYPYKFATWAAPAGGAGGRLAPTYLSAEAMASTTDVPPDYGRDAGQPVALRFSTRRTLKKGWRRPVRDSRGSSYDTWHQRRG